MVISFYISYLPTQAHFERSFNILIFIDVFIWCRFKYSCIFCSAREEHDFLVEQQDKIIFGNYLP